ncbi:MAG: hypothetical protein P0Y53_01415 [Candidatus Pseudobacter hemicellulosilyticus]|uniref:Uncharacterized protein n=1 Tax=Candidatus Pseudobacter hemicellulosilyticus TaxID=3121375 RepID=A0AAJ5WQ69_9BACT|nr:MAG: hypothetical protein P0Y53_01415 [Pseudobacter sp.]
MKYEKNNAFADWLYNRYVEGMQNGEYHRAPLYTLVLRQYISALNRTRHTIQKRHAESLLQRITDANAENAAHRLKKTAAEALKEKLDRLHRDERILRMAQIPEEDVQAMLTIKMNKYAIH